MNEMLSGKRRGSTLYFAIAIAVITIATFSACLNARFVHWDDDINILHNVHIHELDRESITWMFTDSSYTPRYRPLNWMAWAVLYHFFGTNPLPYHALTLVLHGINAALLFLVVTRILQSARPDPLTGSQQGLCAMAVLIWSLHPLRVEAVAWVNCQIYTQSFFFLLLALLLYLRAAGRGKPMQTPAYWGSLACFLGSLLTYPTALAFVILLLAIDFFPLKRLVLAAPFQKVNWPIYLEKVPYAVVTLLIGGFALWARANATQTWSEVSDAGRLHWMDQAAQAFYIWAYYLWKPFALLNISPVYTQLVEFKWSEWPFLLSITGILGISGYLILNRRRRPVLLAIWICYLALLVPMLGLTEHPHYPNDRYSYLVGALLTVAIAAFLVQRMPVRVPSATWATLGCIVAGLAVLSARQTRTWQDSHTLFPSVLAKLGNDPYRSDVLWRHGRVYSEEGNINAAIKCFSESLEAAPGFSKAHVDLATVLIRKGETNAAIGHYRQALRSKPNDALANYNLGVVLEHQGNLPEALSCYQLARDSEPHQLAYRLATASTLERLGRHAEALREIETALKLHPKSADAHYRAGNSYAAQQRMLEAVRHFQKAIELNPVHIEARLNLGTALAMTGRIAEATPHFMEAARLEPRRPQAHLACGMALAEGRRFIEASESYRKAIDLEPDLMPALVNLSWLLCAHPDPKIRDGKEAVDLALRVLKLTDQKQPEAFDLLAAAYAEAGHWAEAVETARRGSSLAKSTGRLDLSAEFTRKIQLYESKQPFRM